MLVRARDAADAMRAADAGVDTVATGLAAAPAARAVFPRWLRLDDEGAAFTPAFLEAARAVQADEVVVDEAPALSPGSRPIIVARIAASSDLPGSLHRLQGCATGVTLDAPSRLLDRFGIAALDAFARAAKLRGLTFGFGGDLEAPDVARLLLLEPDVLGFDAAVRLGRAPDGPLDPAALDAIRSLIPRATVSTIGMQRPLPGIAETVVDRVFVRDFVVPLSIGAYAAERGRRQRVRFGVEAEVARRAGPPRDMREVFSYDIMVETVRVLAARGHVSFVETLAEEVAAAVLDHPAVRAVTVRVEKLDVVEGTVGVEIRRVRPA